MSDRDDLLTAAAYLEGDGVSMEAAEADRIAGVLRSMASAHPLRTAGADQQAERDTQRMDLLEQAYSEQHPMAFRAFMTRVAEMGFRAAIDAALSTSEGKTE